MHIILGPEFPKNQTGMYWVVDLGKVIQHITKGAPLESYDEFSTYGDAVVETVRLNTGIDPRS